MYHYLCILSEMRKMLRLPLKNNRRKKYLKLYLFNGK